MLEKQRGSAESPGLSRVSMTQQLSDSENDPSAHEWQQLATEAPQIHSENCCVLTPPAKLTDSDSNEPESFRKLHHKKE